MCLSTLEKRRKQLAYDVFVEQCDLQSDRFNHQRIVERKGKVQSLFSKYNFSLMCVCQEFILQPVQKVISDNAAGARESKQQHWACLPLSECVWRIDQIKNSGGGDAIESLKDMKKIAPLLNVYTTK